MFVYMGLAKGAFKMIPGLTACQRINGQWWSSLDTSIKCSDTYPTQVVATFVLLLFTAGFPLCKHTRNPRHNLISMDASDRFACAFRHHLAASGRRW